MASYLRNTVLRGAVAHYDGASCSFVAGFGFVLRAVGTVPQCFIGTMLCVIFVAVAISGLSGFVASWIFTVKHRWLLRGFVDH
jgi:hypothetical protein